MDAPLGPCPVCGSTKQPKVHNWSYFPTVHCSEDTCLFGCTREHWNLMRRKLTTDECDALRGDCEFDAFHAATDAAAREGTWAIIHAALTGVKT